MTPEQVRHHITYKAAVRELPADVAERMLAALDEHPSADYASLHQQALFQSPPAVCFHTAPVEERDSIRSHGLQPGTGQNWGDKATGQPLGVYLGPTPDLRGIWSHWDDWDIWTVNMTGLNWTHDRLNPGNWVVPSVPGPQVTLYVRP